MTEHGRYLFGVTRGLSPDGLEDARGIHDAPLELLPCGTLQAVVCPVDLKEFGEEALRRNLEDLSWVEAIARAHDEVVRVVASRSTIAPMRLVTVYADDVGVRRQVGRVHDDLVSALDRVDGCAEWSVKVYGAGTAGPSPASNASDEQPTTGAAYLQRKRDQAAARRSAGDDAARCAQAVHDALAAVSVASRTLAAQDPRLSGRTEPMLHNGAYLVPHDQEDAFRAAAETVIAANPGVSVEVQGPWPPYSFTVLET